MNEFVSSFFASSAVTVFSFFGSIFNRSVSLTVVRGVDFVFGFSVSSFPEKPFVTVLTGSGSLAFFSPMSNSVEELSLAALSAGSSDSTLIFFLTPLSADCSVG